MHVTFVSDAHLEGPDDPRQRVFLRFLHHLRTDLLVLGGDVFQHWWHFREAPFPAYAEVVAAVEQFPRVVLPGNHDFHAPAFFEARGATPGRDGGYTLTDAGRSLHFHHGDHADTSWGYAALSAVLRGPIFGTVVDTMGPDRAWRFLRSLVRGGAPGASALPDAQAALAATLPADVVVFGHTHLPRLVTGPNTYVNAGAFPARWVEIVDGVPRLCGPAPEG